MWAWRERHVRENALEGGINEGGVEQKGESQGSGNHLKKYFLTFPCDSWVVRKLYEGPRLAR